MSAYQSPEAPGPAAARATGRAPGGPPMRLWVIEPVAQPGDTRWQDRPIWRRVLVAAPNPNFARLAAEQWALPDPRPQLGNEATFLCVGFTDEKLYRVRPAPPDLNAEPGAAAWPGRVIEAEILREAPARR